MRRFVSVVLAAIVIAISLPVRREVVGLSMAPDLMPGDRVTTGVMPWRDRWRTPAIDERWIAVLPDGTEAIKRIAACGPATLRIVDGDLELDGRIALPPPAVFVERATVVREEAIAAGRDDSQIALDGESILDDAAFAETERRVLLPVADVGAYVVVRVGRDAAAPPAAEISIGVGDRMVRWRPSGPGEFAFLAGRLDRHLVAVAWRLDGKPREAGPGRGSRPLRLPTDPPSAWSVVEAWPDVLANGAPRLTVVVGGRGDAPGGGGVAVERTMLWRDVLYRPAADGTNEWTLASGEVFLLGDFPSGSIDSRQFGPVSRTAVRHRVTAAGRVKIAHFPRGGRARISAGTSTSAPVVGTSILAAQRMPLTIIRRNDSISKFL